MIAQPSRGFFVLRVEYARVSISNLYGTIVSFKTELSHMIYASVFILLGKL